MLLQTYMVLLHLYLERNNYKMSYKRKSISKTASWYFLILPFVSSILLLYSGVDWTNWIVIISQFVIFYPLLCFGVQIVWFYEDNMTIIRPFNLFRIKKKITYNQIDHIKEVNLGRTTLVLSPYDLLVYVKDKKQPVGIPMPSPRQNREQFKKLIESNGIQAEWGIYE